MTTNILSNDRFCRILDCIYLIGAQDEHADFQTAGVLLELRAAQFADVSTPDVAQYLAELLNVAGELLSAHGFVLNAVEAQGLAAQLGARNAA